MAAEVINENKTVFDKLSDCSSEFERERCKRERPEVLT